ncbi:MAG: PP2C family protein-serine/threonine phosphatase, partial [Acidobacteriota bacterium]
MKNRQRTDYWALYRQMEKTIQAIEAAKDPARTLEVFLQSLVRDYRDSLGITGGRVFQREDDGYILISSVGEAGDRATSVMPGYRVPASYQVVQELRQKGIIIADHTDPAFDETIEGPLNVDRFAAIRVGSGDPWIISFTLADDISREHLVYSLSSIRRVIDSKLRELSVQDQMQRIREIQRSLFPSTPPSFPGYEIGGRSRPIETVGGDVYDFIPLSRRIMGLLVADSSGHGLAAALQARDVVTGMRMGLQEDLKIVRVVEKLNRVIHRTTLSSKFISLFYAEMELNGNLIYCNAGHVPALWLHEDRFHLLTQGGSVLGPSAEAQYERGYILMDQGDVLALYTD